MKKKIFLGLIIGIIMSTLVVAFVFMPYLKNVAHENEISMLANKLEGKYVSVFGDSISTLEGVSNDSVNGNSTIGNNYVFYKNENIDFDHTWWGATIKATNTNLLVNNSFSGDCFHAPGKALERADQLHSDIGVNDGISPDIILIYFGINDYLGKYSSEYISINYDKMLDIMQMTYPKADIFCCGLVTVGSLKNSVSLGSYNTEIEKSALKHNCYFVDINKNSGITDNNLKDNMVDEVLHPNADGMIKMSNCILNKMISVYL